MLPTNNSLTNYIYKINSTDRSRERPVSSVFNSYNTEMLGKTLLLSLDFFYFTLDPYFIITSESLV